jgi:hypothetical protein
MVQVEQVDRDSLEACGASSVYLHVPRRARLRAQNFLSASHLELSSFPFPKARSDTPSSDHEVRARVWRCHQRRGEGTIFARRFDQD